MRYASAVRIEGRETSVSGEARARPLPYAATASLGTVLHLQRLAGNHAVSSILATRPTYSPVQRCGGEVHPGCSCAEQVDDESSLQREESSQPVAPQADLLSPSIARLDSAATVLQERLSQTEAPELVEHLAALSAARSELQRIQANGTAEEQSAAANHFRTAAIGAAPTFAVGAVEAQVPPPPAITAGSPLQRFAPAAAPLVAGAAAAGPPGWLLLAGAAVVVAVVVVVYVATRDDPAPAPVPVDPTTAPTTAPTTTTVPTAVPTADTDTRPRTCATEHPEVRQCDGLPSEFTYSSPQAAVNVLKARLGDPSLRLTSANPSTSGPCPGVGMHYGVKSGGTYIASISCCPCCRDTPAGPILLNRCRII